MSVAVAGAGVASQATESWAGPPMHSCPQPWPCARVYAYDVMKLCKLSNWRGCMLQANLANPS